MVSRKVYTPYKKVVQALQLVQLDVYRVKDKEGRTRDILRLFSPASGRTFLVDLGAPREALSLRDFFHKLLDALKEQKISVPERAVRRLEESLSKLEAKEETPQ